MLSNPIVNDSRSIAVVVDYDMIMIGNEKVPRPDSVGVADWFDFFARLDTVDFEERLEAAENAHANVLDQLEDDRDCAIEAQEEAEWRVKIALEMVDTLLKMGKVPSFAEIEAVRHTLKGETV